jgi:ribosomal-protein-alanine N-acetyltransferase
MMSWLTRLFGSPKPVIDAAGPRDARRLGQLHSASFHRGWREV